MVNTIFGNQEGMRQQFYEETLRRARAMQAQNASPLSIKQMIGLALAGAGFTGAAIAEGVRFIYNAATNDHDDMQDYVELGVGPAGKAIRLRGSSPDPPGPIPRLPRPASETESEQKEPDLENIDAQDDFYRDQFPTPPKRTREWQPITPRKKSATENYRAINDLGMSPNKDSPSFSDSQRRPQPVNWDWERFWHNQNNEEEVPMDQPMEEAQPERAEAVQATQQTSAGAGQNITTPIQKRVPRFPWHHVEQALLEHTGSISCNAITAASETLNYIKIRMNTPILPYAEMPSPVTQINLTQPALGTAPVNIGRYCVGNGTYSDVTFHRPLANHSNALFTPYSTVIPTGLTWFENHYGSYTVTKCEWSMMVTVPYSVYSNTATPSGNPFVIGDSGMSTHVIEHHLAGDTAARVFVHYTSTGQSIAAVNPPLTATCRTMERWENTYDEKVTIPINGHRVLRGTWYPGKVEHNALNDKDIDVWTAVGSVPTNSHLEHLIVQFKQKADNNLDSNQRYGCNVQIHLKYYVQYREPKTEIQYPVPGQSNPSGTVVNSRVLQSGPAMNH